MKTRVEVGSIEESLGVVIIMVAFVMFDFASFTIRFVNVTENESKGYVDWCG